MASVGIRELKSRLTYDLRRTKQGDDVIVTERRTPIAMNDVGKWLVKRAFWPSIDNFERALKFGREESPESKLDKLEALVVTHYGRPLADDRPQ